MNKQELIDKAVEDLKGILPAVHHESHYLYTDGSKYTLGIVSDSDRDIPDINRWNLVCPQSDFRLRARELGWVNGYKWGVEYTVGDEKPDLPDNVKIKWANKLQEVGVCLAKDLAWKIGRGGSEVIKFRIVDERYQPEAEQLGNSEQLGDSWYERGELPPVGTICQVEYKGCWYDTYIVGLNSKGCPVFETPWDEEICYDSYSKVISTIKFRPIKSERDKFIDSCISSLSEFRSANQVFGELFDSGKFMLKE